MVLKLVSNKSKAKIEIDPDCKQKIKDLFLMPEKIRAELYTTISFTEILSMPFKKALSKKLTNLPKDQQKLLSRAKYYDLILDYLTLSALNDQEKKYLFDDLNREKIPFFFKIKKIATHLKKIKTPLTPFTIQEVQVKHVGEGHHTVRQEIIKKKNIKLTQKGHAFLLKLCPNLQVFTPVLIS